jgi:hypothetical protein
MSPEDAVVAFIWDRPATGGHKDLVLRVGTWIHRIDSYYFALKAEEIGPGSAAVVQVLQTLLSQWKERVRQLADGGVVYLPYDFSDQYIAWLRVQRSCSQLDVQVGWSSDFGHWFLTKDFSAARPSDWKQTGWKLFEGLPPVVTTLEAWDRAITLSSEVLERVLESPLLPLPCTVTWRPLDDPS